MDKIRTTGRTWMKAEVKLIDDAVSSADSLDNIGDFVLPVGKAQKKNGLMLDLAMANGASLIAGFRKKYIPIGIGFNLDQAKTSLNNMRQQKVNGYVVVADQGELPFQDSLFDLVWSSSTLRPLNSDEVFSFSEELIRVMAKSGRLKLPLQKRKTPIKVISSEVADNGRRESVGQLDEFSIFQYEDIFKIKFPNAKSRVRSFFGVAATRENFKNSDRRKMPLIGSALAISFLSRLIPGLKYFSDSVFITGQKIAGPYNIRISHFLKHHWLMHNLNVVYILQCPISGGPVYLSKNSEFVISDQAGMKFPVINEVPIMLKRAAIPLEKRVDTFSEVKV